MLRFVVKRLLGLIPVLLAVSLITFTLSHLSAGDAASVIARDSGGVQDKETVEMVRKQLGLDQPLPVQYGRWLSGILKGDLGKSYMSKKPVVEELCVRFPATLALAVSAMTLLMLVCLPLGIGSAMYPGSMLDRVGRSISFLTVSIPSFWLGLLLLYVFGARLKWIPVAGGTGPASVLLPAITMVIGYVGPLVRLLRTSMLNELGKEYVKALRAKGLRERIVISRHALKNAMLPVLTRFGITFGAFLGGSSIVETIFSWRGLGKYALDAIGSKDLPVVQGYVLMMAVIVVVVNLVVDILYRFLDPRIRLD